MKTTKKDFERFCAAFRLWQKNLGLTDFHCVLRHQLEEGCFGSINPDHQGKIVVVKFSTEVPERDRDIYDPARTGRHEGLELLLARMDSIARGRYCFPDDVTEERHAVIRRLENYLDGEKP